MWYTSSCNPGAIFDVFLHREQAEAMLEKIRILEGIWGGDGAGGEGDAGPTNRGGGGDRGQSGGAAAAAAVEQQDATGERADQPRPEEAETPAARDGGGSEGGERSRHRDRPEKDNGGGGGGDGESEDVRESALGGAGGEGEKAAARGGKGGGEGEGGEGDGGVDAWLISYNRRLKSELERLRERTRQAEDR